MSTESIVRGTLLAGVLVFVVGGCAFGDDMSQDVQPDGGASCSPGDSDCGGESFGCHDLTSIENCGACGNVCTAERGTFPVCVAGSCDFVCSSYAVRCGDECADSCPYVFDEPTITVFEVPSDCKRVRIRAWGAGGGHGHRNSRAGGGGYAEGLFPTNEGELLLAVVGAPGNPAMGRTPGEGGLPGGGRGGSASGAGGGGGGGLSGVFRGALAAEDAVLIAGGGAGSGGGTSSKVNAGAGGGEHGQSGSSGNPGSQIGGFSLLAGGPGGNQGSGDGGGGGGAGWWGGFGGNGANSDAGGGGGGSGLAVGEGVDVFLESGDRRVPGGSEMADRDGAGDPGAPGKVLIDCLPAAE
jgi:hypothetical protein